MHTHTKHINTQYSAKIFSLGPEPPARDTGAGVGEGEHPPGLAASPMAGRSAATVPWSRRACATQQVN